MCLLRKTVLSDLDALREAVGEDTAGLMLTHRTRSVSLIEHRKLRKLSMTWRSCYYDGANLNAVMGQARPGDMDLTACTSIA